MNLQPNSIKYSYPVSSYQNINDDIKIEIDKLISDFYNNLPNTKIQDVDYYLDISYKIKICGDYITYIFYISTYMGGAHPDNKALTLTYIKNKRVYTKDVIGNNIKKVSKYIQDNLLSREDYLKDMVFERTTNDLNNYKRFYFCDKGITFIFNPYQVAPYSFGFVEVIVPY